jgi:hypothetical protein
VGKDAYVSAKIFRHEPRKSRALAGAARVPFRATERWRKISGPANWDDAANRRAKSRRTIFPKKRSSFPLKKVIFSSRKSLHCIKRIL